MSMEKRESWRFKQVLCQSKDKGLTHLTSQILTTLKTQHRRFLTTLKTFHLYDFESLPILISSQLEQTKGKSYAGKYSSLASEIAEVSACVYLHNLVLTTGPEIFNVCVFFFASSLVTSQYRLHYKWKRVRLNWK